MFSNLRVHIKVGDLTRPRNVGFSRRAVLHGVSHVVCLVPGLLVVVVVVVV